MSADNGVNDKSARGAAVKSKAAPKVKVTTAPAVEKTAGGKASAAPKEKAKVLATETETQPATEMVEGEDGAAAAAGGDKKKKKKKKQEATHDFRSAVRKHVVRELKALQVSDSKTYGELGQISISADTARVLVGFVNGLIETLNARIHDFFRANPNRQTVQQLEMWVAIREIMRPPTPQFLGADGVDDEVPEDETNLHDSVREAGERAIALYNASLEKDVSSKSASPAGTKKPKVRMTDRIQTIVPYGKIQKRIRAEHSGTRLQPVAGVYATAFIDECVRFLVRCTLVRTVAAIRKKNVGSYILPKHVAQAIRKNRYLHVVFGDVLIQNGGVDHAQQRRRGASKEESKKGGGARRRRPEGANGAAPAARRQKSTGAPASRPKAKSKLKAQPKSVAAAAKKKSSRKSTKKGDVEAVAAEGGAEPAAAEAQDAQNGEQAGEEVEAETKGEAKRGGGGGGGEVASQDGAAAVAVSDSATQDEAAAPEDTNILKTKREPKVKAAPKKKTAK